MAKETKKPAEGFRWGRWLSGAAIAAICVSTAMAARSVVRYVETDPRFTLSVRKPGAFRCEGLVYASRSRVERVFSSDFGRSVYSVPLGERRRRLLAIDWIEDATIERIWPDRLTVRVRERRPVAFVYSRSGMLLIDREGVLLEPPAQANFTFPVLSGIDDKQTDAQRAHRVAVLLDLQRELGAEGRDISEVNVADPDNLRLVANAAGQAVELILGDVNYARRYRTFLQHYPEMHKRQPGVKVFDMRLDDRILAKE